MKIFEKIKQMRQSWQDANRRREEQLLNDAYYITETTEGFFILCNGVAVLHFDDKTTLEVVRNNLAQVRKTAIEYKMLNK